MPDIGAARSPAAFFDVDGTLVATTIVHYYVYFRRARLSPWRRKIWSALFGAKCVYYYLLDKVDRNRLNIVFYRSYAGLPAAAVKAEVPNCYRDVIRPRLYQQAPECLAEHRRKGHTLVMVTGSIDFIIEPLARELGVALVLAPTLTESGGRFTGKLSGPPIGLEEKARRIRAFAETHGIDLARSHAYGDSIADLPMLETVGLPHVVNPDRALAATAKARGWPVHQWTVTPRSDEG